MMNAESLLREAAALDAQIIAQRRQLHQNKETRYDLSQTL